MKLDLFDWLIVLGLISVVVGIALMSIPWACIIGGLGLMLFSVIGAIRKAELQKAAEKKDKAE